MVDKKTVRRITEQMRLLGYTWTFDGEQKVPTEEDVQETLDIMVERLYTEQVPSQMHLGHMIVHRWKDEEFDVYLQMGSL